MSAQFFKNSKCAKRLLPEVFLCLQAVDKMLKPSYLWDAFAAEVADIRSYVRDLHRRGWTDHELTVLSIDDTIFVTLYDGLKRHLDSLSPSNIDLIDVSNTVSVPALLAPEQKQTILEPILQCSREILGELERDNYANNLVCGECNPSTLFGVLLGYPVLYWFSAQPPHSEFACLSMLPLKVHRVVGGISPPSHYPPSTRRSHELFHFSVPANVSRETDSAVRGWFRLLRARSERVAMFHDLHIKTEVVALPSVAM